MRKKAAMACLLAIVMCCSVFTAVPTFAVDGVLYEQNFKDCEVKDYGKTKPAEYLGETNGTPAQDTYSWVISSDETYEKYLEMKIGDTVTTSANVLELRHTYTPTITGDFTFDFSLKWGGGGQVKVQIRPTGTLPDGIASWQTSTSLLEILSDGTLRAMDDAIANIAGAAKLIEGNWYDFKYVIHSDYTLPTFDVFMKRPGDQQYKAISMGRRFLQKIGDKTLTYGSGAFNTLLLSFQNGKGENAEKSIGIDNLKITSGVALDPETEASILFADFEQAVGDGIVLGNLPSVGTVSGWTLSGRSGNSAYLTDDGILKARPADMDIETTYEVTATKGQETRSRTYSIVIPRQLPNLAGADGGFEAEQGEGLHNESGLKPEEVSITQIRSEIFAGSYAMHVNIPNSGNGTFVYYPRVTIKPDTEYIMTFWAKMSPDSQTDSITPAMWDNTNNSNNRFTQSTPSLGTVNDLAFNAKIVKDKWTQIICPKRTFPVECFAGKTPNDKGEYVVDFAPNNRYNYFLDNYELIEVTDAVKPKLLPSIEDGYTGTAPDSISIDLTNCISPSAWSKNMISLKKDGADVPFGFSATPKSLTITPSTAFGPGSYELVVAGGVEDVYHMTTTEQSFSYQFTAPAVSHDVTVQIGANGSVKKGEDVVNNGTVLQVEDGGSLTLTIIPDTGYTLDKALLDTADITAAVQDGVLTVSNIAGNKTLEITFVKLPEEEPEMTVTSEVINSTYPASGGASYPAATLFAAITPGNGWDVADFGVEVIDKETGLAIPLSITVKTNDGRFGVKVFGVGLKAGKVYILKPYANIKNQTTGEKKTVYGTEREFTAQ